MKAVLNPWRLATFAAGTRQPFVDVSFFSRGRLLHALVPSSELWVAVKDVLVLEDYELVPGFRFSDLPPGSTVIDAGAFVGLFSLKVSNYAKRVVALEPSRVNFQRLEGNLRANGASNVEARRVALSSRAGAVRFMDRGTSSGIVEGDADGSYEAKTARLEDMILDAGEVDLLKIDIEGAEYEVVQGTSIQALRKVERLVAEVHFFHPTDRERLSGLVGRLEESGMDVRVLSMPRKDARQGLVKPWNCSLDKLNGKSSIPYRLLISGIYGLAPINGALRGRFDSGGTSMLFASRKPGLS